MFSWLKEEGWRVIPLIIIFFVFLFEKVDINEKIKMNICKGSYVIYVIRGVDNSFTKKMKREILVYHNFQLLSRWDYWQLWGFTKYVFYLCITYISDTMKYIPIIIFRNAHIEM